MPINTLYQVVVTSPLYKTVYDYLNDVNSPAYQYVNEPDKFLAVMSPTDGLSNRQRLENKLADKPETKIFVGLTIEYLPVETGTIFYLEYEKVNYQSFVTQGIEVVSYDSNAFESAQIARLKADKGYVSINKNKGSKQLGNSQEQYPNMTVWLWCEALSSKKDETSELLGELIDITQFIQRISTNMSKNGGNFQITLPPLVAEIDSNNKWSIKKGAINQFENGEYVAEGSLFDFDTDGQLRKNQFFFQNAIKSNDLVFIRFETLELEKDQRKTDSGLNFIDKSNIPNRIYDMIGLVDSTTVTTNPASNDISINISGRDLSKLLIEDGTYFYALENSQGQLRFAGQSQFDNGLLNRMYGDGALDFLSLYMQTSIEYILKFIIQQLSNISIVPDSLFEAYGDRRNKKFNVINDFKNTPNADFKFKEQVDHPGLTKGIWQIVKLVIDENVVGRLLQDSSFSMAQGSILNFIHSACQEPLVQFYMDTYGDQYHLVVRKPPYDKKSIISLLNGRIDTEEGGLTYQSDFANVYAEDVIQESLSLNDSEVYSWYSLLPKNSFYGDAENLSLAYLGALYFPEYAEHWGSKPLQITHPYVAYTSSNSADRGIVGDELQAVHDYKYLIDCNMYLPFTRKGTIVLNGDRRIKIGSIIRYQPSGEIFFVDAVQQNFSINDNAIERTTAVQVSRGMIESFIYGLTVKDEDGQEHNVSYFNVINTKLKTELVTKKVPYTENEVTGTETVILNEHEKVFWRAEKYGRSSANSTIKTDFLLENHGLKHPSLVSGASYLESYNRYPLYKAKFIDFINAINDSGYLVLMKDADAAARTSKQQLRLWLANKHNARPGTSRHEVGSAIDINVRNIKTGKQVFQKSSVADWEATGVPAIAKSMGIQWGDERHIGQFVNYVDRVHFQIATGNTPKTITRDITKEVTKYKSVEEVDRDAIFSNFKVNKFIFNFFLKNLQFDPTYRDVSSFTFEIEGSELLSSETILKAK